MNTKRRSSSRFLSCLLALCLLLTIIPADAESPATPTDLAPVEQVTEMTEPQEDAGQPGTAEDPDDSGEPGDRADPTDAADLTDPEDPDGSAESGEPQDPEKPLVPEDAEIPEGESGEEEAAAGPFLASLKAGARLYADRDCYRKQQILAEEAVVLVVRTEDGACEVLYAYLDVSDEIVPGKAYVHTADLLPLTEDETAAWLAAAHPDAVVRSGFPLEKLTFGTEAEADPGETGDEPDETEPDEDEPREELPEAAEPEAEDDPGESPERATGRLASETVVKAAGEATPTDLSGAADAGAEDLNGTPVVPHEDALPPVRNQGRFGTCWAFSAIGGMEIYLVTNGYAAADTVDLSEFFLAYYVFHNFPDAKPGGEGDMIWDSAGNDDYMLIGGTNYLAFRVLENLIGTVDETTAPYPNPNNQDPPSKYEPVTAQLTGAYLVEVNSKPETIAEIKNLITTHGAIGASVCMPDKYNTACPMYGGLVGYNTETYALYGTATRANHDILLVGWDDSFSRDNFISDLRPAHDGAWKVRNSWGTWGDSGYFWISYEDMALTDSEGTAYSAINGSKNDGDDVPDFCYSYDKIPDSDTYEASTAWVLKRPSPVAMTQSFAMDGKEKILSVGVETGTPNVKITVTVTVEGDGKAYTGSVNAAYKGFYRIRLDSQPVLTGKKNVSVTIRYEHPTAGTEIIIPYEPGDSGYSIADYQLATHSGSCGFILNDETISNADSCIKVYTKKDTSAGVTGLQMKCDSPAAGPAETISIPEAHIGETYQLTAIPTPATGVDTTVRWSSSDPAVAMVDANGLLTVLNPGTTRIVATSVTGVRAVCELTVPEVMPESIEMEGFLGQSELTINNENAGNFTFGETLMFSAKLKPVYSTMTNVTWTSSDPSVLEIIGDGTIDYEENHRFCYVKALRNGRATMTVQSEVNPDAAASVTIIIDLVNGVELSRSSCELVEGDSLQLTANVLPADASNRSVTWTSSDPGVVTVDASGMLLAVKAGRATVTATTAAGGMQAACDVTVIPKDPVEAFVTRLYRAWVLNEPKKSYVRKWVSRLDKKEKTAADLITELYDSAKLKSSKITDEEFLKRAFQGILGRDPDAAGRDKWNGRLALGVSRKYVVAGLVKTSEFRKFCKKIDIQRGTVRTTEARDKDLDINAYVIRLYTELYGRSYDVKGLNKWCAELLDDPTRGTAMDIAVDGFIDSKEFRKRHLDDEAFIRVCYRTFYDREPKAKETRQWLRKMKKGTTRKQVASSLAGTKKARKVMKKYGLK